MERGDVLDWLNCCYLF